MTEQLSVPRDVHTAFRLWRVSIVAAVLSSLLSLLILDELLAIRGRQLPADLDPAQGESYLLVGGVIGALGVAGAGAVALLFAARMRDGRNWARVTLAALGGIVVLYGALTADETFALFAAGLVGGLVALLTLVTLGLTASAIYFMYRPAAAAWFR